jgi:hypothetical protein
VQQHASVFVGPCFRRDDVDECFVAFHATVVVRLDRTIQYAAASRLFSGVSGILDRPVEPGDDGWECGAFVSQDVAAIFKT